MRLLKDKINSIIEHEGFKKYFFNTGWLFFERVIRLLSLAFIHIYIARYLGPERFGVYSYCLAFVAIFGVIARLGLDDILVSNLVSNMEKQNLYLGTAFWLKVISAIFVFVLIGIVVQFSNHDYTTNQYIFIIAGALLFQSFEVVDFFFRSIVMSKYVSFVKIIQIIVYCILTLFFIYIQADLFWFIMVVLIDYITLGIAFLVAYIRQNKSFFFNYFSFSIAKTLLKDSYPLILSGMTIMLYMRIDQIMIKMMLDEKQVGLYSAATRISETLYFIPGVISISLFPAIINAKKINLTLYYNRLQKLFSLFVWISIPIAISMTFLSHHVISLLYGQAYVESATVLMIHIWTSIFVFLSSASSKWYISESLQKLSFYRNLLGALVNILLNLFLIKSYGIIGAAISTIISYATSSLLFDFINLKTRHIFYMKINAFILKGII